ncbi:MAG TPA: LuxR C-terminal-related transcriptional regulator [Rhizomicrobium sp.]|nr:LuxR C-terminal-related transcriptional regulator [Rhizomicrobium sp.]
MDTKVDKFHSPIELQATLLRLSPPRPATGSIARAQLVKRLVADDAPPIMIVQGPAGYGKSTLMQQAKAERDSRAVCTGWLSLHESDNDVARLFRTLQLLLEQLPVSPPPSEAPQHYRSANAQTYLPDWFLGQLLSLGTEVVLFIDEFQALKSTGSLAFFSEFLLRLPSRIRVVVSSRTVPDIGLPRLMIMEKAGLIRPTDLAFTPAEVDQLFLSLDIEREHVTSIYTVTEGWPAAIQLYRLSLAHADGRKSLQDSVSFQPWQLDDYLVDNVLSLYSQDVQSFFLETAILSRMCGALCDAVTKRNNSRHLLIEFEKSGLFVRSLDIQTEWFQYHSLFSEVLKKLLRKTAPAREHEIHDIAARWYKDKGYFEDALFHALENKDYALAAQCMAAWASQLIMDGNLATVEKWFDQIPLPYLEKHPELLIKIAWALAFLRRHKKLNDVIASMDRIEAQAKPGAEADQGVVRAMICTINDDIPGMKAHASRLDETVFDRSDEFSIFQAGSTSILKGHLALFSGDFDKADELLALGRTYGKSANSPFTVLGSISTSAVNLMIRGKLSEALDLLRDAPSDAYLPLDQSVAYAAYAASYISALYERSDLINAKKIFDSAHSVILSSAQVDFLAIAAVSISRLYDSTGLASSATALLDDVEAIAQSNTIPRLLRLVTWEKLRRKILAGDIRKARQEASRIKADRSQQIEGWIPFSEDTEGHVVNMIRLLIHERDGQAAIALIEMELKHATRQRRTRRQIKLLLLDALARDGTGDTRQAQRSLNGALDLARPSQYVRQFLDEGKLAVELLRRALDASEETGSAISVAERTRTDFIKVILAAAGIDISLGPAGREAQPLFEPLSDREREIYALLLQGLRNREIAQSLQISENTVKFHLKNLYGKLGVTNRSKAITVGAPTHLASPS